MFSETFLSAIPLRDATSAKRVQQSQSNLATSVLFVDTRAQHRICCKGTHRNTNQVRLIRHDGILVNQVIVGCGIRNGFSNGFTVIGSRYDTPTMFLPIYNHA